MLATIESDELHAITGGYKLWKIINAAYDGAASGAAAGAPWGKPGAIIGGAFGGFVKGAAEFGQQVSDHWKKSPPPETDPGAAWTTGGGWGSGA